MAAAELPKQAGGGASQSPRHASSTVGLYCTAATSRRWDKS